MPKNHLQLSFSRSSGPGGQNVNKVSTKVELRLLMSKADWIPDYAKERLKTSKHGEVIVTSDRTRSQAKNIEDCYDKLEKMIKESVAVARGPDQATLQRTQQLQNMEKVRRKEYKKKHSQKKNERRSRGNDF